LLKVAGARIRLRDIGLKATPLNRMAKPDFAPMEQIIRGTYCSLKGLRAGWRTQASLRYEIYALLIIMPVAWLLGKDGGERALLMGSSLFVVVVELINSAIETVVDRIGPEYHELSGRAKDLGSAAVFCSIIMAVIIWVVLLTHR
jgi:diacylglycerol kinase (ATP)